MLGILFIATRGSYRTSACSRRGLCQPSVLAICLLTAALYLPVFPRRDLIAGLLVGLTCCVKPQVALPFFRVSALCD
jgi:hypothetical protein